MLLFFGLTCQAVSAAVEQLLPVGLFLTMAHVAFLCEQIASFQKMRIFSASAHCVVKNGKDLVLCSNL